MRGINSDRDGSDRGNGGHQFRLTSRGNVDKAIVNSSAVLGIVSAGIVLNKFTRLNEYN